MCKFIVLGFILLGSLQALSQGTSKDVLEKRISLTVSNMSLIYVLDELSEDHEIPIGLELTENEKFPRVVSFEISDGTLKDVLGILKTQVPEYSWEVQDGVINFFPAKGRNPILADLLATQVAVLDFRRGSSIYEIRDALLETKELKGLMISKEIRRSPFVDSPSSFEPASVERDYCFRDKTMRLILNGIVKETKFKIWTLSLEKRDLKFTLR
ncbi:MAG: hypothetical protein IPN69_11910 [Acidobacteria bacterium]|nr:hypothetical protein [Acidobacteriota bacterium]